MGIFLQDVAVARIAVVSRLDDSCAKAEHNAEATGWTTHQMRQQSGAFTM